MSESVLKTLSDKIAQLDVELNALRGRAGEVAAAKKEQFQKLSEEVRAQADQLKSKLAEYRGKSPDELKAEGEQLLRNASGKVADGLKTLSAFFESKAQGGGPKSGPV